VPPVPNLAALQEELRDLRTRMDEVEQQVEIMENTLIGNEKHKRKGLVDDLAAVQAFVTEIKEFKGKAVGIFLFLSAVVVPVGLWAVKNLDFVQHLFGK
jgi:predicted nuclease with TOPRIM domain